MMAFKLLAMAEGRWRNVNGSELLSVVRAGVRFVDGVDEKPKTTAVKENAASLTWRSTTFDNFSDLRRFEPAIWSTRATGQDEPWCSDAHSGY
jgi:hypothetical protein